MVEKHAWEGLGTKLLVIKIMTSSCPVAFCVGAWHASININTMYTMYAGIEENNVKIDDKSRISLCERPKGDPLRRNASYDNVDNVSYGCVLDDDEDTTGEGIYDTIPEEGDNNYIDIIA